MRDCEKAQSHGQEGEDCACPCVLKHSEEQAQLWHEGEADVQGVLQSGAL